VERAQYLRAQQPAPALASQSVDKLADLITGITLTDNGPDVHGQPSKLFSSRGNFQDSRAADIPISFNPIPLAEAQHSFEALLGSAKPGIRSVERNEDLLTEIRTLVRTTRQSLVDIEELFAGNDDYYSLRLALETATEVVVSSGIRLSTVKSSKEELVRLRDDILSELRELDQHIDYLGALLPKEVAITETMPLRYDAGKPFRLVYIFLRSRLR
jgi:hypothetical protein